MLSSSMGLLHTLSHFKLKLKSKSKLQYNQQNLSSSIDWLRNIELIFFPLQTACMYICVYVCMCVCMYIWVCISRHVCVSVCVYVRVRA